MLFVHNLVSNSVPDARQWVESALAPGDMKVSTGFQPFLFYVTITFLNIEDELCKVSPAQPEVNWRIEAGSQRQDQGLCWPKCLWRKDQYGMSTFPSKTEHCSLFFHMPSFRDTNKYHHSARTTQHGQTLFAVCWAVTPAQVSSWFN